MRGLAETRLGVAVLAAGQSRRFGARDKLTAPLFGRPLGEHVTQTIDASGFGLACVISGMSGHPCEAGWRKSGFEPVVNARAGEGMGTSVAMAARLANDAGCDKLLIALADMPMVPWAHFSRLILAVHAWDGIAISAVEDTRMPPAAFGRDHFAALARLDGDKGARDLLATGAICPCPPEWLVDVDTPEALIALENGFRSPN